VTQKIGHPFSLIPLLNIPELLKILQAKVELKEGSHVSRVAGIPPHIENAVVCPKLPTLYNKTLIEVRELTTSVRDTVSQVYEEKALENGMLTGKCLKQMFEDYHGEVLKAIDSRITLLHQVAPQDTQDSDIADSEDVFADSTAEEVSETAAKKKTHRLYKHEGRMWHVPKNFTFMTNMKFLQDSNCGSGDNQDMS